MFKSRRKSLLCSIDAMDVLQVGALTGNGVNRRLLADYRTEDDIKYVYEASPLCNSESPRLSPVPDAEAVTGRNGTLLACPNYASEVADHESPSIFVLNRVISTTKCQVCANNNKERRRLTRRGIDRVRMVYCQPPKRALSLVSKLALGLY